MTNSIAAGLGVVAVNVAVEAGAIAVQAAATVPIDSYVGVAGAPLPFLENGAGRIGGGGDIPADKIQILPRGGVMVQTSQGWIQFGAPMWSNQDVFDIFARGGGFGKQKAEIPHLIPTTIVVDLDYVDECDGLLPTDFEQYMFFVTQGTPFTIVAPDAGVATRMKSFLDLSLLGPRGESLNESVQKEYPEGARGLPDLQAEISRGFPAPAPDALRQVASLDSEGGYSIGGVKIGKIAPMVYEIVDNGVALGTLDLKKYPVPQVSLQSNLDALRNPALQMVREKVLFEGRPGAWALGTGHGFKGPTSGFMLWNRGKVVLFDPPSNTIEYFIANNLPLDAIDGIVLSHGHTDHFGNSIPRLLRLLPQIKIYSTPTVFGMLQREYELAIGGKEEGLHQWNFVPLTLQTLTEINGLKLRFDYAFHPVPTLGCEVYDGVDDQTGKLILLFTGDTFADHSDIWKYTQKGPNGEPAVMSRERAMNVLRHMSLLMATKGQNPPPALLIEGGIPPIHTDPAKTRELIELAQRMGIDTSNVHVYHIADAAAEAAGVPKWKAGHEGFIDLSAHVSDFVPDKVEMTLLRSIDRIPLLAELPASAKAALIERGAYQMLEAGEVLLQEGSTDDAVYILIDGAVEVFKGDEKIVERPSGIFGEAALLGEPRNATVKAAVPSRALKISAQALRESVAGTRFVEEITHIRAVRREAYAAVKKSSLGVLPDIILDVLFRDATLETYESGTALLREGDVSRDVYVVVEGSVRVVKNSGTLDLVRTRGTMIGEMALSNNAPRSASVLAESDTTVLKLNAVILENLMRRYPGVSIALRRTAEARG
ncbi:MAG: cyclic nucleotide-binding domain-containing protein [Deltaproteobacteria bacterium]|nr:cyclic nucleotide-binding domain-containing protein [Deltaproteobacteria bacterium]